jgi:peroxiredoxin
VEELDGLATTLIAISPQLAEHSRAMIEQKKLNFEILRDPGNEIAHAYGLRWALPDDLKQLYRQFGIDLAEVNGDDSWTLPVPARFIIDRSGMVRYARVDPDYTRRPEPDETLMELKRFAR